MFPEHDMDLIRFSVEFAIDYYAHIVRRRCGLPDELEAIETVRDMPLNWWKAKLTDEEWGRLQEYLDLRERLNAAI